MAKQDEYVRYTIRIPTETYASIQEAAETAQRSVNGEIVERLSSTANLSPEDLRKSLEAASLAKEAIETLSNSNKEWRSIATTQSTVMAGLNGLLHSLCEAILRHKDEVPSRLLELATTIQHTSSELKGGSHAEIAEEDAPQWDWDKSQADAPPPIPTPTSTAAKRQKR